MTYSTLQVNDENIRKTFLEDQIGRNADLMNFIATIHQLAGGKSIALDSPWGSGKTFFVKQAAMILKNEAKLHFGEDVPEGANVDDIVATQWQTLLNNNKNIETILQDNDAVFVPIYYDAWAHDNDENAAISLIYAMLQEVDEGFSFQQQTKEKLLSTFKKALSQFAPQKVNEMLAVLKPEETSVDSLFYSAKVEQTIEELMCDLVDELLVAKATQLIIFIDELDRCKPSYAVQLLEQIKHYMNDERITFVFSVNVDQLQHTICHHYGENFDAIGYLERFFDLRIQLPEVNRERFYSSIGFHVCSDWNIKLQDLLIRYFKFSMREMPKYLNSVEMALKGMEKVNYDFNRHFNVREILIYNCMLVPFLIGLQLKSQSDYFAFINGENPQPLINFVSNSTSMIHLLSDLLEENETYRENNRTDFILVSVEEKTRKLYECIFSTGRDDYLHGIRVGKCNVYYQTKGDLLKRAGLL